MDTKELPARRDRLQVELREMIGQMIKEFEGQTGVGVSRVEIDFLDVSSMIGKRAIISSVTVKLEVE